MVAISFLADAEYGLNYTIPVPRTLVLQTLWNFLCFLAFWFAVLMYLALCIIVGLALLEMDDAYFPLLYEVLQSGLPFCIGMAIALGVGDFVDGYEEEYRQLLAPARTLAEARIPPSG
jgi:hypothetical protein